MSAELDIQDLRNHVDNICETYLNVLNDKLTFKQGRTAIKLRLNLIKDFEIGQEYPGRIEEVFPLNKKFITLNLIYKGTKYQNYGVHLSLVPQGYSDTANILTPSITEYNTNDETFNYEKVDKTVLIHTIDGVSKSESSFVPGANAEESKYESISKPKEESTYESVGKSKSVGNLKVESVNKSVGNLKVESNSFVSMDKSKGESELVVLESTGDLIVPESTGDLVMPESTENLVVPELTGVDFKGDPIILESKGKSKQIVDDCESTYLPSESECKSCDIVCSSGSTVFVKSSSDCQSEHESSCNCSEPESSCVTQDESSCVSQSESESSCNCSEPESSCVTQDESSCDCQSECCECSDNESCCDCSDDESTCVSSSNQDSCDCESCKSEPEGSCVSSSNQDSCDCQSCQNCQSCQSEPESSCNVSAHQSASD
jgi:hypothetical protein